MIRIDDDVLSGILREEILTRVDIDDELLEEIVEAIINRAIEEEAVDETAPLPNWDDD